MSTIQTDFDRIALVSPDGSLQNNHYHNFLLRQLPLNCQAALEIGCGKGEFSRRLAETCERVLALDLSPEMIRIARERSAQTLPPHEWGGSGRGQQQPGAPPLGQFSNIEFKLADIRDYPLPSDSFDCIASIATLHHLPLVEVFLKMKAALKPGGTLLILDLFEPEGVTDALLNFFALGVSVTLRLIHHRRLRSSRAARAAWTEHERHDIYPTMVEVRKLCDALLPGAKVTKHLLWRYSVVWRK